MFFNLPITEKSIEKMHGNCYFLCMIGIVDYNAGNIKSVERALNYIKAPYIISKTPAELKNADRIIFPGVGDAAYAMEQLKKSGYDSFLKDFAASGKPLAGVCLGSQIIFDFSEEGNVECLGILKGKIRHFSKLWQERHPDENEHKERAMLKNELKVPHMGWNDITYLNGGSRLMKGIPEHTDFYFVHSYVIQPDDPSVIKGAADYGMLVPSIIEKDNISVFQFHPEKSGSAGLQILRNFAEL
ncbi:glutamine amidotransferase [Treponema rectale]|uniref:Imidazole glycerol phosphate synthase subunit HisH n=2 Tax=Treponema rectale TaxID=744512 RepID=A0A840SGV1_9SPIR|nr:glutamine amidotransferase [Treponema rectale]